MPGFLETVKERLGGRRRVTEDEVLRALSKVEDPDLHKDIVSLGFVRSLEISGGAVRFEVNLTTPACPVKEELKAQCEEVVRALPGVESVEVKMTATTRQAAAGVSSPKAQALAGVKNLIAVAAGKGGVGKSTVAVNLAYALAATGAKVGILDADIYGPSIPTMLKVDEPASARGQMIVPPKAGGIPVVSMAFFSEQADRAAILRGPMAGNVARQFLTQVEWGELDYLILDYPPGTGDIQLTISQTAPLTGAVIVTTPQEVALQDVRKAVQMFQTVKVPILGVIETMSYFQPPGSEERYHIFGKGGGERLAREYGVTLLGGIPIDPVVAEGGDTGRPAVLHNPGSQVAVAFREAAGRMARQVSVLNAASGDALESFVLDWRKMEG